MKDLIKKNNIILFLIFLFFFSCHKPEIVREEKQIEIKREEKGVTVIEKKSTPAKISKIEVSNKIQKESQEEKKYFSIRILVSSKKLQAEIFSESGFCLIEKNSPEKEIIIKGKEIVKFVSGKIFIDGRYYPENLEIKPVKAGSNTLPVFEINKKKYRGYLEIIKDNDYLNFVNIVDLEDYVKGVVPKEISAGWPYNALCAQAIAARTYALKSLGKHSGASADLCDTVCCQVYGGVQAEYDSTNSAVSDTAGIVVVYDGKLTSTYYHSSCGGATEDVEKVWGSQPIPYLKGRRCPYCKKDPRYLWNREVSLKYVESRLKETGYKVSGIRQIRVVGRSKSGRASKIEIVSGAGREYVTGHRFRILLDPDVIYSTKFNTLKIVNGKLYLSGNGWGHGVGLCQWGLKGMSERGFDYKSMLKYYYHGTSLEKITYPGQD